MDLAHTENTLYPGLCLETADDFKCLLASGLAYLQGVKQTTVNTYLDFCDISLCPDENMNCTSIIVST
jgi:hypothetical protein